MTERAEQMEWERVRWLACVLLTPHSKPGRTMQPRDLIRFPWDTLQPKVTKAQQQAGADMLMKIAKQKK